MNKYVLVTWASVERLLWKSSRIWLWGLWLYYNIRKLYEHFWIPLYNGGCNVLPRWNQLPAWHVIHNTHSITSLEYKLLFSGVCCSSLWGCHKLRHYKAKVKFVSGTVVK